MIKNILPFSSHAAVEEEAISWVVKMDQAKLSEEEKQRLLLWIKEAPRHQRAIGRATRLWGDMDALSTLAELFPLQAQAASSQQASWAWVSSRWVGIAATFLVVTVSSFLISSSTQKITHELLVADAVESVYQTEIGKQSRALLKDGSVIILNTQSRVKVMFDDKERSVYLTEGEAHFEVEKDPQRPFVVYAGNGSVRAVGTAFSIRLNENRVDVTVAEGIVEVVSDSSQSDIIESSQKATVTKLILKQHGVASYHNGIDKTDYIAQKQVEKQFAWKNGKWIFQGETLLEVINEASRYTSKVIDIVDPEIASLRIGGNFQAGDVDGLLDALQTGFGIEIRRKGINHIQLVALNRSKPNGLINRK